MKTNKVISFAPFFTLLFSLNSPAFADGGVAMSTKKGGWNAGVDALYLRANTSNLSYAILTTSPDPTAAVGFDQSHAIVDPTYDWGFHIQVGYWFPCTCYDINLAYSHLNTIDSNSIESFFVLDRNGDSVPVEIIIPPLSDPFLANSQFMGANGKARFDLNVVDLDAGQHVSGASYDMRFFAGLRYANIDRNLYTTGNPLSDFLSNVHQEVKSYFKGVGPRIGVQGRCGQCRGWGLDADVSLALLIGRLDSDYQGNVTFGGDDEEHWNAHEAKNCAVPALEGKLGIDYTHPLGCNQNTSSIVFEAGYQMTSYLVDGVNTPSFNNLFDGEYTSTTSISSSVTFNGPYLGVKYYA